MQFSFLRLLDTLNSGRRKWVIVGLFAIAIFIRLIVAINTEGYKNDLALFYYWSNQLFNSGITEFYTSDIFVDYPPGYMYVLYVLGFLFQLFDVQSGSIMYLLLLKLPIIVSDLLFALMLYTIAKRRLDYSKLVIVLCLFLFNPWTIVNGAVWGQVDILFSFVLILSLLFFSQQSTIKGSIAYAIAALIKPQAFIFMPVILVYLFYKYLIKHLLLCMFIGFSSFLLLALPFFSKQGGLSQLVSLYSTTLSSYPYASLNTFNSYTLFGYNWVSIKETILTMPIELISLIAIGATVIIVFTYAIRLKKTGGTYFYLAAVTIASVYLFVAKMHERYLFPLLVCLLIAYVFEKNRHYLYILIGFSTTTTINLLAVLNIQQTTYTIPYDALTISCSTLNLMLYGYLLYSGYINFVSKQDHANLGLNDVQIVKLRRKARRTNSNKNSYRYLRYSQ